MKCDACYIKYYYTAPNFGTCGQPKSIPLSDSKIINGVASAPHKWPWLVSIRKKNSHTCGGSLISKQFVLTAAHCLNGASTDSLKIVVGLDAIDDYNSTQIYGVEKYFVNNLFNFDKFYDGNDIAVIKLLKPVELSDSVQLICMPSYNQIDSVKGAWATIAGWGRTDSGFDAVFPDKLQETSLRVSNNDQICKSENYDLNILYCLYNAEGHSQVCSGDSGGPFFIQRNKIWYIYGIASFAIVDTNEDLFRCRTESPSYFTKVPYFIDWIADKVYNN